MPKERFELSRALCSLRPERSASASSATPAIGYYSIQSAQFVKPNSASLRSPASPTGKPREPSLNQSHACLVGFHPTYMIHHTWVELNGRVYHMIPIFRSALHHPLWLATSALKFCFSRLSAFSGLRSALVVGGCHFQPRLASISSAFIRWRTRVLQMFNLLVSGWLVDNT